MARDRFRKFLRLPHPENARLAKSPWPLPRPPPPPLVPGDCAYTAAHFTVANNINHAALFLAHAVTHEFRRIAIRCVYTPAMLFPRAAV